MGANRWTGLVGGMLLWSTLILIENSARYVHQDEEGGEEEGRNAERRWWRR